MRPPTVHDLVWTAANYDVAHVQKERFLEPLRLCWSKAMEASPGAAGVARVDLTIDASGRVTEAAVRALLFHNYFLGDTASEAETTFAACAHGQFNKLPVAPATAETGTLSIDLRLLPARPAPHDTPPAAMTPPPS